MPGTSPLRSRLVPRFIRRSFRAKLFAAFLLLGVLASLDTVHYIGRLMWRQQLTQVQSLMYATVVQMAAALDGDAIAALGDVEDLRHDPAFESQRTRLLTMRDAIVHAIDQKEGNSVADDTIVDLYVLGRTDAPGVGRLLVTYRAEEAGRPYDMSRFPMMLQAWEHATVEDEALTDEYGTTLSAYAPIRDGSGTVVAIVGIDSDAGYFRSAMIQVVLIACAMFTGAVIFSLFFAWALSRIMSKSLARLSKGMKRVAGGDLTTHVESQDSGDEFDGLIVQFNEMVSGLSDREAIKRELGHAATIQAGLLPRRFPEVAGFDFSGGIRYCQETGGDYFDFIDLGSNGVRRIGIVVGDVTGHGVASALTMCSSRAVLRATARSAGDDVSDLMRTVNAALVHDSPPGAFMTTFYGVLDATNRQLIWSNAGHDPGLLMRRCDGSIERLESGDIPLGIDPDRRFDPGAPVQFSAGDLLVIGTDGISQSRDSKGCFFGFDRMGDVMRGYRDGSAREIRDALLRAAQLHEGTEHLEDDATLLVVKCDVV